jgi:hypothetical protein
MTQLSELNEYALDRYLRGEAGEEMRRVAQQELWERGQAAAEPMTEEEMVEELKQRGYVVLKPRQDHDGR